MLVGFEPTPASDFAAYSVCKLFVGYYLLPCQPIHLATCHKPLQCLVSSFVPYVNTLTNLAVGLEPTNDTCSTSSTATIPVNVFAYGRGTGIRTLLQRPTFNLCVMSIW